MSDNTDQPFSESNLESSEYRERLLRKLNTLIAVLEVASAKVQKTLAGPEPDVERLTRIRDNLKNTLGVCERAKVALERREAIPKDLQENLANIAAEASPRKPAIIPRKMPQGAAIEMSSAEELKKFEKLKRIESHMVEECDLEDLMRRLQG